MLAAATRTPADGGTEDGGVASVANEVCACRGNQGELTHGTAKVVVVVVMMVGRGGRGAPKGQAVITHGKSLWSAVRLTAKRQVGG